jgi:hypothetical protein
MNPPKGEIFHPGREDFLHRGSDRRGLDHLQDPPGVMGRGKTWIQNMILLAKNTGETDMAFTKKQSKNWHFTINTREHSVFTNKKLLRKNEHVRSIPVNDWGFSINFTIET